MGQAASLVFDLEQFYLCDLWQRSTCFSAPNNATAGSAGLALNARETSGLLRGGTRLVSPAFSRP
ncbi:MAG: hypothetical protein RR473_11550, partial [Comamonas sp.]